MDLGFETISLLIPRRLSARQQPACPSFSSLELRIASGRLDSIIKSTTPVSYMIVHLFDRDLT